MDASEFFNTVVKRNYEEWIGFTGNQDDFRLLWNAIVSMNTVPEYLALDQLGYAQVLRELLDGTAKQIRDKDQSLIDLKFCAETPAKARPRAAGLPGPVSLVLAGGKRAFSDSAHDTNHLHPRPSPRCPPALAEMLLLAARGACPPDRATPGRTPQA
jgi:hypothetical protein